MPSYNTVILDIEGTTTPITFVKDVMFPYVTTGLTKFLIENWGSSELNDQIELLRQQAEQDVKAGINQAVLIPQETSTNADQVRAAVERTIEWQMQEDRKIGALKSFQGYMWKEGFESGELRGQVYDDVVPAFDRWKEQGCKIYIYSSGSVPAQKLLFGYSEKGDLLHYFSGHFDTSIGLKVESTSYDAIAKAIQANPSDILFVSDNVKEIIAAEKAGFQVVLSDRPDITPLTEQDRLNRQVVTSFSQIP
ncbi:2,3-diketo-5-methylthio-1-phosphopentane phosphatase [Umbelopsis sp. PMI_123]|nr:2,3-diketo-5-methylthio-1-phosphopentane phosphatase [Umbelopsis sp. PMI_123]